MEPVGHRSPEKRRRRRCCILSFVAVVLLIVVVAVLVALALRRGKGELKHTFITRCNAFKGYDCDQLWESFQQAYIGRDPCNVPMEAYDPFIAVAHFEPECNRMMFWSKTKDMVHDFTEKKDCYVTLEDTLLGSVANDLTWCGKEGSSAISSREGTARLLWNMNSKVDRVIISALLETFTTGCPGWNDCPNNTVRSYWNRASVAFADAACGDVTAMLNGSISTPFHPSSIFASIEVKNLNSSKVDSLNVVLVTQENFVTNCTNASLKELQKELDAGIKYNCKEVAETQIQECTRPEKPCGSCW